MYAYLFIQISCSYLYFIMKNYKVIILKMYAHSKCTHCLSIFSMISDCQAYFDNNMGYKN